VSASFPRRELTADEAVALSYGKRLQPTDLPGVVGAFDPEGRCVALMEDGRPLVVFRPA
jgi:tRNA pseudouridine55 synthase